MFLVGLVLMLVGVLPGCHRVQDAGGRILARHQPLAKGGLS